MSTLSPTLSSWVYANTNANITATSNTTTTMNTNTATTNTINIHTNTTTISPNIRTNTNTHTTTNVTDTNTNTTSPPPPPPPLPTTNTITNTPITTATTTVTKTKRLPLTEDVCFLCKEGGNLVECDEGTNWSLRVKAKHASLGKPAPAPGTAYSSLGVPEEDPVKGGEGSGDGCGGEFTQCKKVYHAYCMGFNIGNDELGSCPRHACLDCGEAAVFHCRHVR